MAADMAPARTLFDKIWERHKVVERDDGQTLLYVDCHYIHDGSRRAFDVVRAAMSWQCRRTHHYFLAVAGSG